MGKTFLGPCFSLDNIHVRVSLATEKILEITNEPGLPFAFVKNHPWILARKSVKAAWVAAMFCGPCLTTFLHEFREFRIMLCRVVTIFVSFTISQSCISAIHDGFCFSLSFLGGFLGGAFFVDLFQQAVIIILISASGDTKAAITYVFRIIIFL